MNIIDIMSRLLKYNRFGDDKMFLKRVFAVFITVILSLLISSCGNIGNNENNVRNMKAYEKLKTRSFQPSRTKSEKNNKSYKTTSGNKINYETQKAVWLSYIDISPMLTGKSEYEFKNNFTKACENILSIDCNTIYLQLRPFGDSIYESSLYPTSRYITGTAGGKINFDPLKVMLDIAHSYKLSVHGWINPLRCENEKTIQNFPEKYSIKRWYDEGKGKIKKINNDEHLWLNPAYEEVRELIADGACEIAEKYDIDGIHFDDYFYPTTDNGFDSIEFKNSGAENLDEWRMENISLMVKDIYDEVKSVDEDIQVGVSPQGNMENNYKYMYADVKKWCSEEGYIDYIVPQIYFGYENSIRPFAQTVSQWQSIIKTDNVKLIIGLGAYKVSESSETEFNSNEGIIAMQIEDTLNNSDCSGFALYNYINLFSPEEKNAERVFAELKCIEETLKNQ